LTDKALVLDGKADHIKRLHQYPPVEWDGDTGWTCHLRDSGEKVLLESAQVDCPDCESQAFWRDGTLRCEECGVKRLIG